MDIRLPFLCLIGNSLKTDYFITFWLQKNGDPYYRYEGWWTVWWKGTYSFVLAEAAFFHRKYLDMYASGMPSAIYEYLGRER